MMQGKGMMTVSVMWALTAITIVFVALRLYTRYFVLGQIGADDHAYWLAGLLLLLYTIFMHIAANSGFGQPIGSLQLDDAVIAVRNEMIGQTFAVIGMAVAKLSLGLFLTRIVVESWHRVAIWIVMGSLMAVSVLTAIMLWTQCLPSASIYDPRVKGKCNIKITPFAILLGVWCAVADFFFAIFPWIFIWGLNMKRKEKITIAGSMSFGVVAGLCGIVRTIEVASGFTANYTEDTVNLIIWSAAEMAVTLVCVGIPVLRPLYRRVAHGSNLSSERYYKKQSDGNYEGSYDLNSMSKNKGGVEVNHRGFPNADPKLGIRGPSTITRIAGDNQSDESILGREYRTGAVVDVRDSGGIQVKEDVRVEWTKGEMV